jgi:hypothetical protein
MKLKEYKIDAWDNQTILETLKFDSYLILLLKIDETKLPIRESIKNLLSVDLNYNIKWVANLPKGEEIYAYYDEIKMKDDKVQALCNSHIAIIDPLTGVIVNEQFVK